MIELLALLYTLSAGGLALYGLLGLLTLALFWRHRHDIIERPSIPFHVLPPVTVQLPLFNESSVVRPLLQAVARLDYPRDRLQIQVIDDSTDETTALASAYIEAYRTQGLNILLLHREHRQGYKAGALAEALKQASGEFIAIFDADFQPLPDFLLQTIPHFLTNEQLGAVQTRWGHLNADLSPLTAAQALALDKHFAVDQTTRHRARLFPKFNGSAGVWRKCCIEQSGNWESDTLCEDLCLSVRAVLDGWELLFLPDVEAPAELPASVLAYKSQQARWATGSIQCFVKYGRAILRDRRHSLLARTYALLSMAAYSTHLLLLLLLLLQVPLLYFEYDFSSWLLLFSLVGISQPVLFVLAQQLLYSDWLWRLRHLPTMLLLAISLAPSSSWAVLRAMGKRNHVFVRTPKGATTTETERPSMQTGVEFGEFLFGLYAIAGLPLAIAAGNWGAASFLFMCALGFLSIAGQSLREARRARGTSLFSPYLSDSPYPNWSSRELENLHTNQYFQYRYKQNQFPY
jgi:cellulose synthase/poly-beta-1,6-N-acetylglucosamine synthase-like glycosyltransferase